MQTQPSIFFPNFVAQDSREKGQYLVHVCGRQLWGVKGDTLQRAQRILITLWMHGNDLVSGTKYQGFKVKQWETPE